MVGDVSVLGIGCDQRARAVAFRRLICRKSGMVCSDKIGHEAVARRRQKAREAEHVGNRFLAGATHCCGFFTWYMVWLCKGGTVPRGYFCQSVRKVAQFADKK